MSFPVDGLYVLRGKLAVPAESLEEWGRAFNDRKPVAVDGIGGYLISTVFLGIDHAFGHGLPILFETMVFDAKGSTGYQTRCGTWEEAIEQHEKAVAHVVQLINEPGGDHGESETDHRG